MLAAQITGDSEQQERPTALPGHPGMVRNQHGLQDPGRDLGPAVQQVREARRPRACDSARLLDAHGERRGAAEAPKASKGAWPRPPGREASVGASAAQQETTLQRLLELHSAARRRRRQDCEQQRLRVRPRTGGPAGGRGTKSCWPTADSRLPQVLERLSIARNRHCRVHPLGPPPSPAQLPSQARPPGEVGGGLGPSWARPGSLSSVCTAHLCRHRPRAGRGLSGESTSRCCPLLATSSRGAGRRARSVPRTAQEDAAGQRRALREQLQQMHQERTGWLRALGAR